MPRVRSLDFILTEIESHWKILQGTDEIWFMYLKTTPGARWKLDLRGTWIEAYRLGESSAKHEKSPDLWFILEVTLFDRTRGESRCGEWGKEWSLDLEPNQLSVWYYY